MIVNRYDIDYDTKNSESICPRSFLCQLISVRDEHAFTLAIP